MVLLFLCVFGTTRAFAWDLSGENASIIVFSFWGTAEMSDLVRGALISVPRHQYESGEALAMNRVQIYRYIIIPQTVRRLVPLSINLVTRMIKTTSLILMVGVVEILKVAQQIIEANRMSSPNAAIWSLPGCVVAVFHGMLADQYICKIFGKEMEGMIYGRDIAYNKTSGQAIW